MREIIKYVEGFVGSKSNFSYIYYTFGYDPQDLPTRF